MKVVDKNTRTVFQSVGHLGGLQRAGRDDSDRPVPVTEGVH